MSPYEKAVKIIEAEHKIVQVLYDYIDRMNDPTEDDTMEKIGGELVESLRPVIKNHLSELWRPLKEVDTPYKL